MDPVEFLKLLESGGVDVCSFNARARKLLIHLYNEVCDGDCTLKLINGRVIRSAVSVKVLIKSPTMQWLETAREYENAPPERCRSEKLQGFTFSETVRRGEKPLNAAIRCLAEEGGNFNINLAALKDRTIHVEPLSVSESSVYPEITSVTSICRYKYYASDNMEFTKLPYAEGNEVLVANDNGTRVFVSAFTL